MQVRKMNRAIPRACVTGRPTRHDGEHQSNASVDHQVGERHHPEEVLAPQEETLLEHRTRKTRIDNSSSPAASPNQTAIRTQPRPEVWRVASADGECFITFDATPSIAVPALGDYAIKLTGNRCIHLITWMCAD